MRFARYVKIGVFLVVAALASFFVVNSSYFRIQDIVVQGASKVPGAEIIALTNLYRGQHMYGFKADEVVALVRSHPWVARAKVLRHLPGNVTVTVTERKPIAVVPSHNGYLVVDEESHVVDFLTTGRIPLPVITGFQPNDAVVGDRLLAGEVATAIRCIMQLTPFVAERISEVNANDQGEVTVFLLGGLRVYMGLSDAQLPRKFALLESLLGDINKSKMDVLYIDLRYGNPIIKPRTQPAPPQKVTTPVPAPPKTPAPPTNNSQPAKPAGR